MWASAEGRMLARSCPTDKRSLTGRPFVEPKSNAFLYGLRFSLSRFVLPIIADGFPALEDENFEHLPPHAVPAFATLTWARDYCDVMGCVWIGHNI